MLEEKKRKLHRLMGADFKSEEISDLMDQVSIRYFLNSPLKDMSHHFRLALTMGKKKLHWHLEKLNDVPVTRVILCTYDRPGLFSKMVGVLSLNNIDVLSANIFTLKSGLAFDTYEVTNPVDSYRESESWEKIHREILLVLEDRLPLDDLITRKGQRVLGSGRHWRPTRRKVQIDNEVSDFFTGIEVSSEAKVGLLYELAKEVFALGLDIRFARVNCDDERMTGVFYVRDSDGQKIHGEEPIKTIEQGILSGLR
jgi:[protein-PII] uridylyltransferase